MNAAEGHPPANRYAVLLHTGGPDGLHYDFLIEPQPGQGDLLTWRVANWPVREGLEVLRLRDHRRVYLTFQGTISGDRGEVTRVDDGLASLETYPRVVRVRLAKGGVLRFDLIADDRWQLTPEI